MGQIVAALNITLDGFCDHTAGIPDGELHDHYTELIKSGDVILYGRTTFQLMEFWRSLLENPSESESMNAFASAIDAIPKLVFSRTLQTVDWETATLSKRDLKSEVLELKQQAGKKILVGSRSLIVALLNLELIDELQLCFHPVLIGQGQPLFAGIYEQMVFQLKRSKSFKNGAVLNYYIPARKKH